MLKEQAIEIKGLVKSFNKTEVLKGVDLTVNRGSVFALLGPNGAGKTTIVKILSTLLRPDSGSVKVNGFDVVENPHEVRSTIGLTGQYAAVDEYLSARENLLMMGRLYHLSQADTKKRADELLEQFDLVEAANRPVKTFSGGMRRRLDLALSVIAAPPIIFLDEPTTGLDPRSRNVVWDIVDKLIKGGTTVLLTTQYLEEADQLADKIAVIDGGKVIAEGTADQLKAKVGKEQLELTIAKQSDFAKAVEVIKGETTVDASRRFISVAMEEGAKGLTKFLNNLEKAGIEIDELSLRKPTLDDVFLKLTGHDTGTVKTEEGAK